MIYAIRMLLLIASISFTLAVTAFWFGIYPGAIYIFLMFVLSLILFVICTIKEAQGITVSYARRRREPDRIVLPKHKKKGNTMA